MVNRDPQFSRPPTQRRAGLLQRTIILGRNERSELRRADGAVQIPCAHCARLRSWLPVRSSAGGTRGWLSAATAPAVLAGKGALGWVIDGAGSAVSDRVLRWRHVRHHIGVLLSAEHNDSRRKIARLDQCPRSDIVRFTTPFRGGATCSWPPTEGDVAWSSWLDLF
jgi:hypothetical protein